MDLEANEKKNEKASLEIEAQEDGQSSDEYPNPETNQGNFFLESNRQELSQIESLDGTTNSQSTYR